MEPHCNIRIPSHTEEEWRGRGGLKADWIKFGLDGVSSCNDFSSTLWIHGDYFWIRCDREGKIDCGYQEMTYEAWKNNPRLQERAFEEAYKRRVNYDSQSRDEYIDRIGGVCR